MKDFLTVIIPTYNNASFLQDCVESLLKQREFIKEIIVVNDGSTDNTPEILRQISEKEDKVSFIETPNRGVSHARNVGLSKAKGDYITFVDSDDIVDDGIFGIVYEKLVEMPNIDVVRYNFEEFGGKRYCNNLYELSGKLLKTKEEIDTLKKHLLTDHQHIPNLCQLLIYNKSALGQVRFDENVHFLEDAIFYEDILDRSNTVLMLDEKKYRLRFSNNSSSRSPLRSVLNIESLAKANKILVNKAPDLKAMINSTHFSILLQKISQSKSSMRKETITSILNNDTIRDFLSRIQKEDLSKRNRLLYKSLTGSKHILLRLYLEYKSLGRAIKRCLV